jgi:cation diffusion facilitator CzcD-associated flavoprotein CzcO
VRRTIRHGNLRIHLGTAIASASRQHGCVRILTSRHGEPCEADFLILGTGFRVDLAATPKLGAIAAQAATWADRYEPPPELRRPDLARYPYLGPAFELLEREPGASPALSRIHLFNYAAHLSHRQLSGDIPGVDFGAERLSRGIAQSLFQENIGYLTAELERFAEPELEGTPFFALHEETRR